MPRVARASREQFKRDGFLHLQGVFPRDAVVALRDAIEQSPPPTSRLVDERVAHQLNRAALASAAAHNWTMAGRSAALALQLTHNGPRANASAAAELILVNSIVYGVRAGQPGADWHCDVPSYRHVRTPSASEAISVWTPLSDVPEQAHGGALLFAARSAEIDAVCASDPLTGRPTDSAGALARTCTARLQAAAVRLGRVRAGDAVLFSRDVWHATSPADEASPLRLRWSYTERFVPPSSTYEPSGFLGWVRDFPMQPPCAGRTARQPRPGGALDASPCFPRVRPAGPARASETAVPPTEEARLVLTGAVARALAMCAYLLRPAQSAPMVRLWWRCFALTQALEVPLWAFLLLRARGGGVADACAHALVPSVLTHPAAFSLTFTTQALADALPEHWWARWRSAMPIVAGLGARLRWAALELLVIAVEAEWARGRLRATRRRAWAVAALANLTSIAGGFAAAAAGVDIMAA